MVINTGKVRVTFVPHVRNPDAPTVAELAAGTELTFARDERTPAPVMLPERQRFEVVRWPDGRFTARQVNPNPHEPTERCLPVHCHAHDRDESATGAYRACGECGHAYATEQDLVDAYNRIVTEMNADGAQRYGAEHEPRPLKTSAADIYFCQHCMHDF